MSKNTYTLTNARNEIAEVRGEISEVKAGIAEILTRLGATPVAPVAPVVEAPKAQGPSFMVLRHALKAHKAAGAIKPGVTVKEAIAQGLMRADGSLPTGQVVVVLEPEVPATPRKARKVSERAPEPEYGTDAWIAWARPTDDGAPRRADGSATPKREWKARMALAESGQFDAKQIDAAVAASVQV